VAVGAGAGAAVGAADATGRDAAGRAAAATGFFFFAIGFFDVVTCPPSTPAEPALDLTAL
jgi:hypothetical protein